MRQTGHQTITAEWRGTTRHLRDLKLFEVSLTSFPAQALATVSAVKSAESEADLRAVAGVFQEMREYVATRAGSRSS